ncbi:MAG: hypothetical protein RBT51_08730, partial [Ectothiorhodospiraceae bacterium]|nr:hypothetical protein [Ectothiorhodospiraceae bacterium]
DRPEVRQRITAAFGGHGIDAERLILEGASPRAEYFACFDHVDVSLDPFPYRGGAVTFQSLWMGVPVLTLERPQGMIGRYGAAILAPLGLDDWVATDEDDYVARACRFAADPALLAELRAGLRQRLMQSTAGDGARFVRQLETLLREVWRDGNAAR